jgi:hypothetical protein
MYNGENEGNFMGRPSGSVNSKKGIKKVKVSKTKKRRGRPKNIVAAKEEAVLIPTKKSSFIGYCNRCFTIISSLDLESPQIFNCLSCGKRANINKLKKEVKREKYESKKEYLATVHSCYNYEAPMNDPEIKDLRVAE